LGLGLGVERQMTLSPNPNPNPNANANPNQVGVERQMALSLLLGGSLRALGQHALCCGLLHKLVGELSLLSRLDGRSTRQAPSADGLLRLRTL